MCNTIGFREYLACLSANYYEILVDTLVYPRRHGGDAILMFFFSEITRVLTYQISHNFLYLPAHPFDVLLKISKT